MRPSEKPPCAELPRTPCMRTSQNAQKAKFTIHDIFGRGDRVAYRWSASGTHLGEWAGIPPTGLHMTTSGITILRIAGGRCVEGWASLAISQRPSASLLGQRGLRPQPDLAL